MTRYLLISAPFLLGCSALAQPPVPSLSPSKADQVVEAVEDAADDIDAEVRETLAALGDDGDSADDAALSENATQLFDDTLSQGGLIRGRTTPGTTVKLVTYGDNDAITDSRDVEVDTFGNFLFGFDRDHGPEAVLMVTYPGMTTPEPKTLPVAPKAWRESSITVAPSKANPYKPEDLEKIARERDIKAQARRSSTDEAMWLTGFEWPADGCISSDFGSRRIVNGTPRRFHSGVDVAAPDGMSPMDYIGTEVRAPADGIVKLARPDMFFEGGLIFLDHGQGLYSYLMHLSSVDVSVGETVSQGDPVGKIGMTGRVTGPHLHWSLRWQNRLLDPSMTVADKAYCTD